MGELMRELLVIRHAIAHERSASDWPNDDERPLTAQGVRKFGRAASGLARLFEPPDELLTSSLARARQTAAILEDLAGFPTPIESAALHPTTDTSALVAALATRGAKRLAIVGHEPTLSLLIGALLAGEHAPAFVAMKKGAVAQLVFSRRIEFGAGRVMALLPPRVLRAIAGKR